MYKTPENIEDQNKAEQPQLFVHTINHKHVFYTRYYRITYKQIMEGMDGRYKINVRLFKEYVYSC